jgi:hypothetical protein
MSMMHVYDKGDGAHSGELLLILRLVPGGAVVVSGCLSGQLDLTEE